MAEQEKVKPWGVVTEAEGKLHSSWDTEGQASAAAERANKRAEETGISARYKVTELKELRP